LLYRELVWLPEAAGGVRRRISSFMGELRTGAVMSVSIHPGAIALTWIL
jgi:hypothetical protein